MKTLYIIHPNTDACPSLRSQLGEQASRLTLGREWEVKFVVYGGAGFSVERILERTSNPVGPVILLPPPVQLGALSTRAAEGLRTGVRNRKQVFEHAVSLDIEELNRVVQAATTGQFENTQDHVPLRVIVALKILDKLGRHNRWGGDGMSNHLTRADLPSGFLDHERGIVLEVEELLHHASWTCRKKGDGELKVWLNRDLQKAICDAVRAKRLPPELARKLEHRGHPVPPQWMDGFGTWADVVRE